MLKIYKKSLFIFTLLLLLSFSFVLATPYVIPSNPVSSDDVFGVCNATTTGTVLGYDYKWYINDSEDYSGGWVENKTTYISEFEGGIRNEFSGDFLEYNDELYYISGSFVRINSFRLDESSWIRDEEILNGINQSSSYHVPTIFDYDGIIGMMVGHIDEGAREPIDGFTWNGSSWNDNNTLEQGLDSISLGDYTQPSTFIMNDQLHLIIGGYPNTINGFTWKVI